MNQVLRVHAPSKSKFMEKYLKQDKPVIITGLMDDWEAIQSWNDMEYMKQEKSSVPIVISRGRSLLNPKQGWGNARFVKMAFSEFIELIENKDEKDKLYYYMQNIRLESLTKFVNDIKYPPYFDSEKSQTNIWIGSGQNISPIHYDFSSNLLAQVRGQKKVVLFPPSQSKKLYPFSPNSKNGNLSPIIYNSPDYDKYPKLKDIESYEAVLNSGEMLFIPTFWWHHVETTSDYLTISINFWWRAPISRWLLSSIGWRTTYMKRLEKLKALLSKSEEMVWNKK